MTRLDSCSVTGVACGSDVPAIEVRGLHFAYPGAEAPVLDGLDWSVPQGAFALLVGGTGSGKSTLLSLLKPEISPTGECAGELRVLGESVADMDVRASAERVGYVFQDPENQIVCETVWHEMAFGLENLGMSRDEMRRRVAETSYFFGLEDWLHRDTDTLSGGRKQLLSLAAVLALRPRVLLLDEPTSQLDPVAEKNFLHALFRVNRELGCTVVVATHQPRPMLEYATCAYRIEGGRVCEVVDLASLGSREGLLALDSCWPAQVAATSAAAAIREGWFRYDRASGWVLRGLDAAFSAGAVHAVVGGNGCGKSTMLSVLAKTVKLQRGHMERGAGSAALLPQNPKALLVAETVRDELMEWASTCGYDEAVARERAASLGLSGLDGRHPYDLSGGQRQLLALAKLLLIGPELLLLDEPTKGLDLASRRIIARALRGHAEAGGTVIMATHDLDFAEQVADDIAMMFDGEIACMEPPADFFSDNVFYRA
jgi:energy-coupling factor transport system ATP-binding protein